VAVEDRVNGAGAVTGTLARERISGCVVAVLNLVHPVDEVDLVAAGNFVPVGEGGTPHATIAV
jgi:hypothetical protein